MRRTGILAIALGPAVWPAQAEAQSKRCLEMNCFSERQVRDFEVIDRDTMVIYVGRDRCAYRVQVDSLYCDLTFLPEVDFFDVRERRVALGTGAPTADPFLIRSQPGSSSERVCTHDPALALETFAFSDTAVEAPYGRAACEVLEMDSISDDELLEVYVDEGLTPPPPPIGNGDISRSGPPADAEQVDLDELEDEDE